MWETFNLSQTFHCLPSDVWDFDASTPKGYYFNRGVYLFGRMVQSDMDRAEQAARKNRKGKAAERLATGARLGVLSKHLREDIKRFRDPMQEKGSIKGDPQNPDAAAKSKTQDEVVRWKI